MAAPAHQSRFAELVDLLKAEYDRLSNENASYKGVRTEWSRKVEEQASELSAMLAELQDLERKHQIIKDQYEAEIMRLKGQTPPTTHSSPNPGMPSALPHSSLAKRRADGPGQPPYPTVQNDVPLPTMFGSTRPLASASGAQTAHGMQGQLRLGAISTLPPTPVPPGGGTIPAINPAGMPRTTATGLSGKMPSMSIMPPNGTQGREVSTVGHVIKKDPTLGVQGIGGQGGQTASGTGVAGGGPVMVSGGISSGLHAGNGGGSVVAPVVSAGLGGGAGGGPGNGGFGAGGRGVGGRMQSGGGSGVSPQTGNEEDWVVYYGGSANGSLNMKVSLHQSLSLDSVVCCVRYSWDGQLLATGSNRCANIFDARNGQPVATFSKDSGNEREEGSNNDSYVRAVCFSPDGNWLITGAEDHVVKVWDVRNRKVKHRLVGHETDIYSVDASANSHFIISGSGDKKAKLWSLESGKLLSTLGGEYGPTDGITSVSVSPTSQHVAAGSLDKIVRVWDVETSRLVRQFEGHQDSVYSVAFSPDGRLLLSGSLDKSLKLWDLAASQPSGQCRLSFTGHKDFVLSVAFSPNGRWLISGSKDRTVQFWDPRQSSMCVMLQGHKNSVISIAHNPRSRSLATGSGDCRARMWSYN